LKPKEIADSFPPYGWRSESMTGQQQVDQAALFYEFSPRAARSRQSCESECPWRKQTRAVAASDEVDWDAIAKPVDRFGNISTRWMGLPGARRA